jgi:hypothetical protein
MTKVLNVGNITVQSFVLLTFGKQESSNFKNQPK